MAKSESIQVVNNKDESRFEAGVDGKLAVVEYSTRPGVIVFTHSEVPEELSGRGIAQTLVKTALDYAREHDLKVVPLCSYVRGYIDRHGEYQDLLAN